MGFQPGIFALSHICPITASTKEPKKPINYHLRLTWKPKHSSNSGSATLKSDEFTLGKQSLIAHLVLETQNLRYCNYNRINLCDMRLSLQVATEHVGDIIGRVIVHVNSKDPASAVPTNIVSGTEWILPTKYSLSRSADFNIEVDIEFVIIDYNQKQEFAPKESQICKDLGSLLMDKESTDITLKVGTTELRAHKFMLSARSPVLKTMLSSDMLEGRTGVIELQNMSEAAATAFLSFIYTTQIEEKLTSEIVEELFNAAVMYDMPDLLAYTQYTLREIISVENVGRLLLLACLHDAVKLKIQAFFFFKSNKTAVTASEGWKEVIAANPTVMFEAIMDIV